jgi:hypothetical protein
MSHPSGHTVKRCVHYRGVALIGCLETYTDVSTLIYAAAFTATPYNISPNKHINIQTTRSNKKSDKYEYVL